ncbi:MAG TPA: hypothetical protein VFY60_09885 [Pyrinomonadaceae bacterium]|nr:hypothetical protein [Pyrinomonadaceae bacterium]
MNGYLNNLVMRSMDSGPRVEPRLPSMFEAGAVNVGQAPKPDAPQAYEEDVTIEAASSRVRPSQGADQVSTGVTPASTSRVESSIRQQSLRAEDASLVDAVPPVTPSVTSAHDRVEPASVESSVESLSLSVPAETAEVVAQPRSKPPRTNRPADASDRSSEIHEERVVEPNVPVEQADIAPRASQSQTESMIEVEHPTTVIKIQSPKPARPTTPLAPRATGPIKPRTSDEAAQTDGPTEIETYVEEPEKSSDLPSDTHVIQALDPTLSVPQQNTANPWRETRSQPAHWRRRQSPGPTEPEPSINVTIGRIEIRAVPADNRKTNASRRSESPVMPLDEYLRKQRRGAER